ncbi:linoleate diol synthase [Truncatella angustata]|uniref:linoleate 8R-lipoxygenase n=1 Tax=Truncatella angustata TaxID=152316 RepID=A0A9P8UV73_9PEZI|nr:linoleate diol synthase [Truncatella angustata]KAH6659111.1 linoleate diol synthase [Truncatella angustata]
MASFQSAFAQTIQVILRALSPIPKYSVTPGNDDTTKDTGLLQDLLELGHEDVKTLGDLVKIAATGEEDDNSLFLERLITLLAKLPPHSHVGKQLTNGFVNTLWDSLEHPPPRTLDKDLKYREADGSYNNSRDPLLGASGTPCARTVSTSVFQNPDLPEPGIIFDSIMSRGDGTHFREHPNKISSMFFYLATIITHDCFQTDAKDQNKNMASSYLDLSPLYGSNKEEQMAMRTLKNGFLKSDCFASKRVLGNPPGVGAFLIMFNRFHNYVVTQLAHINENCRFKKPASAHDDRAWKEYDNDLFQTGRLITCGLYVNIILKDYVRTILNLNRSGSTWDLDPRTQENRSATNSNPASVATGNHVSVEFNLIYRWHSAISQRDEKWTTNLLRGILEGVDPAKATISEMLTALTRFEKGIPDRPEERPFAELKRDTDGTYSDDDLVDILASSVEDVAGAFGASQVPSVMRIVELLGITQSRNWHVATLNEFRQHFGLKKHETFEDINPDPEIAERLMALYDTPDSVELYPGIVVEKPKPPMSGSGLCIGYTTSQAILSDAVALVRGDRFYTIDYTPRNLTNWGYNESNFDLSVNQGHVMHKLIFRAFPNHFVYNSIYAHFPFVSPAENMGIHKNLGTVHAYSWARPERKPDPVIIKSHKAVMHVLNNNTDFYVPWGEAISYLVSPPQKTFAKDFCLSGDGFANQHNREHVSKCLYQPKEWENEIKYFFTHTTRNLLMKSRQRLPFTPIESNPNVFEVDIVRDVIVPVNTRFVAEFFALPIKTVETSPHGIYTEQELYGLLTAMFTTVFFDSDPANSFKLRTLAKELALGLEKLVRLEAETDYRAGWLTGMATRLGFGRSHPKSPERNEGDDVNWPSLPDYGRQLLSRMMEKGKSIEECIAGTVMPISAAGTTIMSGILSQCLDYFLGAGNKHLPELYRLAHENTAEADDKLLHYMLEGIRLRGTVVLARQVPNMRPAQNIRDDVPCLPNPADPTGPSPIPNPNRASSLRSYTVMPTQRAIVDLVTASHDPLAFPDPEALSLDRPLSSYLPWGAGPHKCLGDGVTRVALAAAFKVIVALPGLRRAPGPRGESKSLEFKEWRGQVGRKAVEGGGEEWTGLRVYMTPDQTRFSPVPTGLRVRWMINAPSNQKRDIADTDWVSVKGQN